MEVDPDTALEEFRELVKGALGPPADPAAKGGGGMMGNMGLPDFKGEISEMLSGQFIPLFLASCLAAVLWNSTECWLLPGHNSWNFLSLFGTFNSSFRFRC